MQLTTSGYAFCFFATLGERKMTPESVTMLTMIAAPMASDHGFDFFVVTVSGSEATGSTSSPLTSLR